MTAREQQDIAELKRLIRSAVGMDGVGPVEPDLSLPYSERANSVRNHWNGTPGATRAKRTKGPISGFFRHAGTPLNDSSVVFDAVKEAVRSSHELEQDLIAPEVNDTVADSDPEIEQLVKALKDVPEAFSKRAIDATTRNNGGTLQLGQSEYNARHGQQVAKLS